MSEADFKLFAQGHGITIPDHFLPDGTLQAVKGGDAVFRDGVGAIIPRLDEPLFFGDAGLARSLLNEALDLANAEADNFNQSVHIQQTKGLKTPSNDEPVFPDVKSSAGGVRVLNTSDNLMALGEYCGLAFRFNQMMFKPEIYQFGDGAIRDDYEVIKSELVSHASRYGLPKIAIDDHLMALCKQNQYHPVKEWLDSGVWDGIGRFDRVIECLNAKNGALAHIAMKRWCIGAVASLYEDNFKSKLVPVLQGGQSFRKTAFVERLARVVPSSFLEGAELNPDSKDSVLTFICHWLVELGELERTTKNSQGSLKGFFTKAVDTVRPPYGRNDIEKPRQTSCIATVNGMDFLKDETGSSRFAVIELAEAVNLDELNKLLGWSYRNSSIKQVKPELLRQFWLEIKSMYDAGEGWNLSASEVELFAPVNNHFNDRGVMYDYFRDCFLKDPDHYTAKGWVRAGELVEGNSALHGKDVRQVGKALKQLVVEGYCEDKKGSGNTTSYRFLPVADDKRAA